MTFEEPLKIDLVAVKGKEVKFFIIEGRRWDEIESPGAKLFVKLENIKRYAASEAAIKKYKGKKITIAINTKYDLPNNIKKLLKRDKVEIYVNLKRTKF